MKTFSLCAIIGLFLFISTERFQAQSLKAEPYLKENLQNKAWPGVEELDSSVTETWDTITNQWVLTQKDNYTYIDYGRVNLHISYVRDTTKTGWIADQKWELTYARGMDSLQFLSQWDIVNNQWVYKTRKNTNSIQTINCYWWQEYSWDKNAGRWTNYKKYEIIYDTGNNKTSEAWYHWDVSSGQWAGENKQEFSYESNGKDTLKIIYNWDSSSNQWAGDTTIKELLRLKRKRYSACLLSLGYIHKPMGSIL